MENKELAHWCELPKPRRGQALGSLHEMIDSLFDDWRSDFDFGPKSLFARTNGFDIPRIDLLETDKEIKVAVDLPGMDEKDIEVTLSKDNLLIKGEKKEEREEKKKNYYRKERSFGSIYREISLPCEVLADKVHAEFKKGVLNITLPKSPQAQKDTVKIPVKEG